MKNNSEQLTFEKKGITELIGRNLRDQETFLILPLQICLFQKSFKILLQAFINQRSQNKAIRRILSLSLRLFVLLSKTFQQCES